MRPELFCWSLRMILIKYYEVKACFSPHLPGDVHIYAIDDQLDCIWFF